MPICFDIARDHPVLLVLGDVHRTDQASKELVDALSIALKDRPSSQLLMVVTTTDLIQGREPTVHGWSPSAHEELTYEGIDEAEIRTLVNHRLAGQCGSDTDITDNILAHAGRNPLFAHALVGIVERILTTLDEAPNDLTASRLLNHLNGRAWRCLRGAMARIKA